MTPHPQTLPRVIKHGLVKANAAGVPLTSGNLPAAPSACAAPAVRLVRQGNSVKAIRVDCLCGRSLEIECEVEDSAVKAVEQNR